MTRTTIKVITRNFLVEGHSYLITMDDAGEFWGFDNNRLQEYNGINGHHGKSLNETLASCYCSARSENELNQELIQANDINELMKLMQIVEDSNKLFPYTI